MKSKIITAFVLCVCFLTISASAQKSKNAGSDEIAEKLTDTKANNAHFAETLLAKGANPAIKSKKGKTAKDYEGKDYAERHESLLRSAGRIK